MQRVRHFVKMFGQSTDLVIRFDRHAVLHAAGRMEHRVTVEKDDEIGRLAEHFNEMTDALHASRQGLEEKIAERTREISALYAAMTPLARSGSVAQTFEAVI